MLMSSTLVRDSSSVLRSRPIGLPRYHVNEKCGPRMPPPASHWHPTEFLAVLTSPDTRVCSAIVWSLMPPHWGKNGPCVMPCAGGGPDGESGDVESDPEEHAANTGIMAAAATASTFTLLGVTAHTVAAATQGEPERHADLPFQRREAVPVRSATQQAGVRK